MAKATNAVAVCLGLTAACGGAVDAPEVTEAEAPGPKLMVLRADLIGGLGGPDGQIVLDARKTETIYVFDESAGPLPWHRIELTCPNNSTMPIRQWIEMQSFMKDRVEAGDRFSVSRRELKDPCLECHLCPDGVWSCVDLCQLPPSGGDPRYTNEPRWAGLPFPPFPVGLPDPPPPPPDDPLGPPDPAPEGSGTTPGGSAGGPTGGNPSGSGGSGGGSTGGTGGGGGGSGSGSGSGSGGGSNGGGHPTSGGGAPGGGLGGGGGGW